MSTEESGIPTQPSDIKAERALLGSLLLDPRRLAQIRASVRARDFYDAGHRKLFTALCELADAGVRIEDAVVLCDALRERGELEAVGGADCLISVAEAVPSAANAQLYAEIVVRKSRERRALRATQRLTQALLDRTASAESKRRLARAIGSAFESNGCGQHRKLVLRSASEIQERELRWCWAGRVPFGGISVLVGRPGLGKSTLAVYMAARVSSGAPWPDGSRPVPGRVLLINAEDAADRIICPRLRAAGACMDNVKVVEGVVVKTSDGDATRDIFNLSSDTDLLEQDTGENLRMIILDPVSAFLPGVDDNSNSQVRAALAKLAELAERRDVAVVLIHHFRKLRDGSDALTKIAGSLAFGALARSVLGVAQDPARPSRRFLVPIKSNWTSEEVAGLAFGIVTDPATRAAVVAWEGEEVHVRIDELLAPVLPQDPEVRDLAAWLKELLRKGPLPAKQVKAEAKSAGYDIRLLSKAKTAAGVESRRVGFGNEGCWEWFLPAPPREC